MAGEFTLCEVSFLVTYSQFTNVCGAKSMYFCDNKCASLSGLLIFLRGVGVANVVSHPIL